MKAARQACHESLLPSHCNRIEVGILAVQHVGDEREQIKLHRQVIFARGHQKSFERAQRAFRGNAVLVHEMLPSGPPTGAQHVDAGRAYLRHVAIPHVCVGVLEIHALHIACHISRANNCQRLVIYQQVILVGCEPGTGAQIILVVNPKSGMIDGPQFGAFHQTRLNGGCLRRICFGRNFDLYRQLGVCRRLAEPAHFQRNALARQVQWQRRPHNKLLRASPGRSCKC